MSPLSIVETMAETVALGVGAVGIAIATVVAALGSYSKD